jgi:predicted Zn-dependent protease
MQHALFRMVHSGGGVNYHDFLLARRERKVRAADVYVYLSGEELSETMAGFMKMVVSRDGKVNQHKRYYFQLLEELRKKSESADYATALQTFDALPDALKTSKTSLMYGMISAKSLGYAEREEEMMVQYRMNHHTVPDRMLLGIDYYYDRGQLDSSLLMINGLDSLLQKDDYMQYLRAALYAQTDRVDESMELLEELVRIKDCMAPPVIMLAWLKANTGDLAGAAKLHRRYRRMPDADADEARRLTDEYPDLLKSKRAEGAQQ